MKDCPDSSYMVTAHPQEPGEGAPVTWCAVQAEARRNITVDQLINKGLNWQAGT